MREITIANIKVRRCVPGHSDELALRGLGLRDETVVPIIGKEGKERREGLAEIV